MKETAKIVIGDKTYECPVILGTEGEKAIDISALRSESGYVTFDPGLGNTATCRSAITFLDGEKGVLRYRGIPVEQLAEHASFLEVAYLLIYGHLPTEDELDRFSELFTLNSMIHEDMKHFFNGYPQSAHPMGILSAAINSLAAYYPEFDNPEPTPLQIDMIVAELMSKVRTISAFSYKKSIGEPFVYPRGDLKYVPNFLHMMFSSPIREYNLDESIVDALKVILILHADHEQNCSTSTVRMVSSSKANLFASISAGICALWGRLHGGANQGVIEMLETMHKDGGTLERSIEKAKDKNSSFRLMGFGHRVYKNYDPRATIIKQQAHKLLGKLGIHDPLLDLAVRLEERVQKDAYFVERKLYPNVDFYSGIILRTIGIPLNMFTVIFAIGRLPGWIAHWKERIDNTANRIWRPRQIYIGNTVDDYTPIERRTAGPDGHNA